MLQAVYSTACHLSLSRKSQLPYILSAHKTSRLPRDYTIELHSMHVSPLKAMGTIYQIQSQGYRNTAYLSSPDIWVSKPDCLHLPYTLPLLLQAPL